jgi:hypothetical protein
VKLGQGNKDKADQANDQVNQFNINTLKELIAFTNQASDQAADQAKRILDDAVDSPTSLNGDFFWKMSFPLNGPNYNSISLNIRTLQQINSILKQLSPRLLRS